MRDDNAFVIFGHHTPFLTELSFVVLKDYFMIDGGYRREEDTKGGAKREYKYLPRVA